MDIDVYTGAEVLRAGVDEVEEAGASIKLGEEERGIGLASGLLIHCRQGRMVHQSLHPFLCTRHPLQLILICLVVSM